MNHQEALASAPRRDATTASPSGLGARLVCAAALLAGLAALAVPAHAQYVWIDAKGVKQFSDRPPESSVPEKNILKAPGKVAVQAHEGDDAPKEGDEAAPKPKAAPTLAERNADFDKRRAEAAEKDQKTAQEAKRKSDAAANCKANRAAQQALKSGMRMRTVDANGQQTFMSDAERAQQTERANQNLAGCD